MERCRADHRLRRTCPQHPLPVASHDLCRHAKAAHPRRRAARVVHVALLFVHPAGAARAAARTTPSTSASCFDVGGRGDKSFNDGAYRRRRARREGARRARPLHRARRRLRPRSRASACSPPRRWTSSSASASSSPTTSPSSRRNTRTRNSPASTTPSPPTRTATSIPPPPNLAALKFREEQGSFLVGALAALVGKSKKVGFVGGMDSPLIHKFEAGYSAGVKQVCPDCTVHRRSTPASRRRRSAIPGKGKELALSQYQQGVERHLPRLGLDGTRRVRGGARRRASSRSASTPTSTTRRPGYVLTSMVKGVDDAVFDAIKRVKDGTLHGRHLPVRARRERRRLRLRRRTTER